MVIIGPSYAETTARQIQRHTARHLPRACRRDLDRASARPAGQGFTGAPFPNSDLCVTPAFHIYEFNVDSFRKKRMTFDQWSHFFDRKFFDVLNKYDRVRVPHRNTMELKGPARHFDFTSAKLRRPTHINFDFL